METTSIKDFPASCTDQQRSPAHRYAQSCTPTSSAALHTIQQRPSAALSSSAPQQLATLQNMI